MYRGFIYNQETRMGSRSAWKCMEYFRLRCRGRCQTVDFKVTKVTDIHCHPPVPEIIKKKMAERQNQQSALSWGPYTSVLGREAWRPGLVVDPDPDPHPAPCVL